MGKRYLIDSNCVVDYLALKLPRYGHVFVRRTAAADFNLSVISRIEILGHESANEKLYAFLDLADIYALTDEIADQAIEIRKKRKIKLPDAIIAATALVNDFVIVTRNINDFKNIEGLNYLNPYEIE